MDISKLIEELHGRSQTAETEIGRFFSEYFQFFLMVAAKDGLLGMKDDAYCVESALPRFADDALQMLVEDQREVFGSFRGRYAVVLGTPPIDLKKPNRFGYDELNARFLVITCIADIFADIFGNENLRTHMLVYFLAQDALCVQHLRRFLIAVYRKGLFDIIKKTDYAPMSGVFGSTELSSNRVEGGMFIRFRSWQSESLGEVIFSGAIEDPSGNSFGIHTITTEQHGVDALVQEVVSYWPEDPVAQMSMFRISANTRKLN